MMKQDIYTKAFGSLGNDANVSPNNLADIEKFTCALYGMPRLRHINDVRFSMFQQKYAPKKQSDPLKKILGINPSSMPPCHAVLFNKILRTNFVASLWKQATLSKPCTMEPENHGWTLNNGSFKFNRFDGEQEPQSVLKILNDEDTDGEDEEAMYSSDESEYDDDELY